MSAILSGDCKRYKVAVEDDVVEEIDVEVAVVVVEILPFFNKTLPPAAPLIGESS